MATNRIFEKGTQIKVAPTDGPNDPAASGDHVIVGQLPGVALTDADDTIANGGQCTVQFDGVFDLPVNAWDTSLNTGAGGGDAVVAGDILFFDPASNRLRPNSADADAVRFGYALEPVAAATAAGDETTIRVKVGY